MTQVRVTHVENCTFLMTHTPLNQLVVGCPWLVTHPVISWIEG